jgi:hypothetical protein
VLLSFWQDPPTSGLCRIILAANLDQLPFQRAWGAAVAC